jgi:hypothetical protein
MNLFVVLCIHVGNSNSINGGGRLQLKAGEKEPLLTCGRSRLTNFFSASLAHNTPLYIEGANPNPNDHTNGPITITLLHRSKTAHPRPRHLTGAHLVEDVSDALLHMLGKDILVLVHHHGRDTIV